MVARFGIAVTVAVAVRLLAPYVVELVRAVNVFRQLADVLAAL